MGQTANGKNLAPIGIDVYNNIKPIIGDYLVIPISLNDLPPGDMENTAITWKGRISSINYVWLYVWVHMADSVIVANETAVP